MLTVEQVITLLEDLSVTMAAEDVGGGKARLEEWMSITKRIDHLRLRINGAESHAQFTAAIKVIEEIRARVKIMKIVHHLWFKVDSVLEQCVEMCEHWGGKRPEPEETRKLKELLRAMKDLITKYEEEKPDRSRV